MKQVSTRGFTLIELLVVVAIIGILSSFAIPYYNETVRKGQRKDAIIGLTDVSQRLERCFTEYNRYNHANCPVTFPVNSPEGRYIITTTVMTASGFTLVANPTPGTSGMADAFCTTFTLAHTGMQGATGSDPDRCWQ